MTTFLVATFQLAYGEIRINELVHSPDTFHKSVQHDRGQNLSYNAVDLLAIHPAWFTDLGA